jgi:hypothetical protein
MHFIFGDKKFNTTFGHCLYFIRKKIKLTYESLFILFT